MNKSTLESVEKSAAIEHKRHFFRSQIFHTINHLITAGLLLGIGFFAYRAIVSLAGKET